MVAFVSLRKENNSNNSNNLKLSKTSFLVTSKE